MRCLGLDVHAQTIVFCLLDDKPVSATKLLTPIQITIVRALMLERKQPLPEAPGARDAPTLAAGAPDRRCQPEAHRIQCNSSRPRAFVATGFWHITGTPAADQQALYT
jgi:hypothetical protein